MKGWCSLCSPDGDLYIRPSRGPTRCIVSASAGIPCCRWRCIWTTAPTPTTGPPLKTGVDEEGWMETNERRERETGDRAREVSRLKVNRISNEVGGRRINKLQIILRFPINRNKQTLHFTGSVDILNISIRPETSAYDSFHALILKSSPRVRSGWIPSPGIHLLDWCLCRK